MAASTRLPDSLQIYQDDIFASASAPMVSHAPMPSAAKPPRRPLQASNPNVQLNPPGGHSSKQSPFKSGSRQAAAPLTPLKASQGNKLNMVSFKPPTDHTKATDSMPKKQPVLSRFKTAGHKPVKDPSAGYMGKENSLPVIYPAPKAPTFSLSIENYYPKPPGKRLLEPALIKDSRPQKKARVEDGPGPLPPPDAFPPIIDDGMKPQHSYAMLIGMALLRSPGRRLTLAGIYKWITDNYKFYTTIAENGWQNSIRHNLSLNKAFIKQERPKDDPGKGNYWSIEPGMEHQFMKDKPLRKTTSSAENIPVMSSMLEPSVPNVPMSVEPLFQQLPDGLPAYTAPTEPIPAPQPEPSSDATIQLSDSAPQEERFEQTVEFHVFADQHTDQCSPLPAAMHSSPPIPRHVEISGNTPPSASRVRGSSATRSHKRKFASMDDSGYISSLESSVLRANQNGRLPTSDYDRPSKKIKRGRAEEEIARLRASSYDSPTKHRSMNGYAPPSSSPLRHGGYGNSSQMPPPLTPAVRFKKPPRPPPSVSPGTNLRIHRESIADMINSPLRHVSNMPSTLWEETPMFNFDDSVYKFAENEWPYPLTAESFQIYSEEAATDNALALQALQDLSPVKQSGKRRRLDRSQSSMQLGELPNTAARRSITSAPMLKPCPSPAFGMSSPSKFLDLPSSPSKLFASVSPLKGLTPTDENAPFSIDDFLAAEVAADLEEYSGLDILQGFEKIGSAAMQPPMPQARALGKPAFGRSHTSTF